MTPAADSFLTGSLLTLVLPIALLVGVIVWWAVVVRRSPK
jgi:hypothetical protein